jgi:hypothetical protein
LTHEDYLTCALAIMRASEARRALPESNGIASNAKKSWSLSNGVQVPPDP